MDQVFDPFITTKKQGMGLGLSISQGIIESHGHRIVIEANAGKGLSFSFKLDVLDKKFTKVM